MGAREAVHFSRPPPFKSNQGLRYVIINGPIAGASFRLLAIQDRSIREQFEAKRSPERTMFDKLDVVDGPPLRLDHTNRATN